MTGHKLFQEIKLTGLPLFSEKELRGPRLFSGLKICHFPLCRPINFAPSLSVIYISYLCMYVFIVKCGTPDQIKVTIYLYHKKENLISYVTEIKSKITKKRRLNHYTLTNMQSPSPSPSPTPPTIHIPNCNLTETEKTSSTKSQRLPKT